MTTADIAPGRELVNPVSGTRTVFLATATSTAGEYVEVEATYPPHSARPALHHHPSQVETFTVLTGAMTVVRGDETFVAEQGGSFSVPAGVRHRMWNHGDDEAVVRWRTSPALRTDEMFCAVWQLAHDHDWSPRPADLLEVVSGFAEEFRLG